MAMIHAGETITPANVQTPYAGPAGGSGGGGDAHLHIHTVDANSFQSFLTRGGGLQIMRFMSAAGPLNPSLA
jgi:hypothetical protein